MDFRRVSFEEVSVIRKLSDAEDAAIHRALTALLDAASRADAARVAEILDERPALVNERGTLHGHTGMRSALHFAVGTTTENKETIKVLLERGADPNVRDEGDNAYPLHFASELLDLHIVRLLVEHGGDPIGAGDMHELEVIGWAACFDPVRIDLHGEAREHRRREVIDYLLAHGAKHTLFSAVAMGDVDDIRRIAVNDRTTLERMMDATNQHRRPLHLAVVKKQLASLKTLLELNANVEHEDDAGLTPLDQAALNRAEPFVDALLAAGAQLRLPAAIALDRDGDRLLDEHAGQLASDGRWGTLIVRAAERSPASVIERLIAHGASPNVRDREETAIDGVSGYTPLHAAAFHGNRDAASVLLAHGARVTARDSRYHGTPAGWADYAKHIAVRDMILAGPIDMFDAVTFNRVNRLREIFDRDPGALNRPLRHSLLREPDPNDWTKSWWTPLATAVRLGNVSAARELLEIGARVDIKSPEGLMLRDIAARGGDAVLVRMLEEYGDNPSTSSTPAMSTPIDRDALVARFLTNACPDHHIRGGASHEVAHHVAAQLLMHHPELARENIYTAVVCGDREHVAQLLAEQPNLAREKGGPKGSAAGQSERFILDGTSAAQPLWEPLLYLCYTRLDHPAANDNAVDIARMLLDHGADPNAYFMAGDSRYSPLSGVIGEGEENRPPHPRRDEVANLLLTRGANPYDIQVYYNIHFNGRLLWFLEMIYEETVKRGRKADWDDPEWSMLDMGGYGSGARFTLEMALRNNDVDLVEWALAHGATPNAQPARAKNFPKTTLYEEAERRGLDDIAMLLLKFGAEKMPISLEPVERFNQACIRRDRATAAELVAGHPHLLDSHVALHAAAGRDDRATAAFVLDLGVSPNVVDQKNGNQLALHVAAFRDSVAVARLLIERGADVDRREDSYGATPLGFAIYGSQQRMMKLLAQYSNDIWNIVLLGAVDRVRTVLKAHPELAKSAWPDGTTALMRLPGEEGKALEIAQLLLDAGADPAFRNAEGKSAADYADERELQAVAALLRNSVGPMAQG